MIVTKDVSRGRLRLMLLSFGKGPVDRLTALPQIVRPPIRRVPLRNLQRQRLREKVAALTCSTPWAEDAAAKAEQQGVDPNSAQMARQLAERGIYPPRPELGPLQLPRRRPVRMRRCDACGRLVPPNNLASNRFVRVCDDCRIQPEVDLDEIPANPQGARAPGAQLCTLVEGNTDADENRRLARRHFREMGLTDAEVMALSFTYAGYSTRGVAELGRWSQTYVRKLLQSAGRKLRRCGLQVPRSQQAIAAANARPTCVDPLKLDAMSTRVV
jgi:hypothetical protein